MSEKKRIIQKKRTVGLDIQKCGSVSPFMSSLKKLAPEGESTFTLKISAMLFSKFSEFVDPYAKTNSQEEKAILYSYLAGGSAGVINYWIKTGFKEKEEAIAGRIIRLTSSTIHSFKLNE